MSDPGLPSPILCRPAFAADRPEVLSFLERIWEGDDYVPEVWDEWVRQERGLLAVAIFQGKIVGQGHLADLGFGEWWLEGLRVHPEFRQQHIGSHLHDYFVERWLERDAEVVRLATHSQRVAVHKMCERTGFAHVASLVQHEAEAQDGDHGFGRSDLSPEAAAERLSRSSVARALGGLFDLGWKLARIRPERLRGESAPSLWNWREGEGLLAGYTDQTADPPEFFLSGLDAPESEIEPVLADCRRLASGMGLRRLVWLAPEEDSLLKALAGAGFEGEPDTRLYIFERTQ